MINFILSYIIFLIFRNKENRSTVFLITEPLLVYSDGNYLISIFILTLFLTDYIDLRHCDGKQDNNSIRHFAVVASGLLRVSFFFYTIYYYENNGNNILYAIYLIVLTHLDCDESQGSRRSDKIYDIVDYISRVVFLLPLIYDHI